MTIKDIKDKLCELPFTVVHMLADPDTPAPCLCWQEIGGRFEYGDNAPVVRMAILQFDYFTTDEYDEVGPIQITKKLSKLDASFDVEPITFDVDRQEWRHIWTVKALVRTDA